MKACSPGAVNFQDCNSGRTVYVHVLSRMPIFHFNINGIQMLVAKLEREMKYPHSGGSHSGD
jgi:hypothetical protein